MAEVTPRLNKQLIKTELARPALRPKNIISPPHNNTRQLSRKVYSPLRQSQRLNHVTSREKFKSSPELESNKEKAS